MLDSWSISPTRATRSQQIIYPIHLSSELSKATDDASLHLNHAIEPFLAIFLSNIDSSGTGRQSISTSLGATRLQLATDSFGHWSSKQQGSPHIFAASNTETSIGRDENPDSSPHP
jgi:hypothetical protein